MVNGIIALAQAARLASSFAYNIHAYEPENYSKDVEKALNAGNSPAIVYELSQQELEESSLNGLDNIFDQIEDSAQDTAQDIDEVNWNNMSKEEKVLELISRANNIIDKYGDILGDSKIDSDDSLEDFANNLREKASDSDSQNFKNDATNFLRNYDATNNFEDYINNNPQEPIVEDDKSFVTPELTETLNVTSDETSFWTDVKNRPWDLYGIMAGFGLAGLASAALISSPITRRLKSGYKLRKNGTKYLVGERSYNNAKELSKTNKKIAKMLKKLKKNPNKKHLKNRYTKALENQFKYAKKCYESSLNFEPDYSILKKYAKSAQFSSLFLNRQYTNKETFPPKSYRNLMGAVKLYSKAQKAIKTKSKDRFMNKALKKVSKITMPDVYYGKHIIELEAPSGKKSYPIFPQRYISSKESETTKFFDEICKFYPSLESKTYKGKIEYKDTDGKDYTLAYSFDNFAAASAIKSALLAEIPEDAKNVKISEYVKGKVRTRVKSISYDEDKFKAIQKKAKNILEINKNSVDMAKTYTTEKSAKSKSKKSLKTLAATTATAVTSGRSTSTDHSLGM